MLNDSFKYLMITNDPNLASALEQFGVNRIFIDLEINGKHERQGHLDTIISNHSISDIALVKNSLKKAELLVRINPYNKNSKNEIEQVIVEGADIIMLPMFKTIAEIEEVGKIISGRVKFIPLVETVDASNLLGELEQCKYVDEIHIGLNDLHLDLGLTFMFELLESGYISNRLVGFKKPFGIGGIARVGSGEVDGELVMAEHVKLNSNAVILSRSFHNEIAFNSNGVLSMSAFKNAFGDLINCRKKLLGMDASKIDEMHSEFCQKVKKIVEGSQK